LAPIIQSRSLVALTAALILVPVLLTPVQSKIQILNMLILTIASWNYSVYAKNYFERHKSINEFILQRIEYSLPSHPGNFNAIALFGKINNLSVEAEIFNSAPMMRPIILSLGAKDFWDCRSNYDARCLKIEKGIPQNIVKFTNGNLEFSRGNNNIGVVNFNDRF